ncbi:hypothetical protein L7F22_058276, partial [Adiantum nelumboides]|nr:hypothetical protein [Adiantum nelumboides]
SSKNGGGNASLKELEGYADARQVATNEPEGCPRAWSASYWVAPAGKALVEQPSKSHAGLTASTMRDANRGLIRNFPTEPAASVSAQNAVCSVRWPGAGRGLQGLELLPEQALLGLVSLRELGGLREVRKRK